MIDLEAAKDILNRALEVCRQHIDGHERDPEEEYPECMSCKEVMGRDGEPSAFCSTCAYRALDEAAPAVVMLEEALREIAELRREGDDAKATRGICRGERHFMVGGYDDRCQCGRVRRR